MLLKCLLIPNLARIPQTIGTTGLSCLFTRRITQQMWKDRTKEIIRKEKKIFLIENKNKWEEILPLISRDVESVNALGFDAEWVLKGGKRNPVALLQLATYSGNCVILRLNQLQSVPSSLMDILENREIVKVGVGCEHDDKYLCLDYKINVRGWMDLRHLALQDNVGSMKLSLESLARHYLGRNLNKDFRLKISNWESRILAQKQVTYAAEDAVVGVHVLLAQLNRLWNPVHEESWEKLTCSAIREICQPFLDTDFSYRHEFDATSLNNNNETQDSDARRLAQLQSPEGKFLSFCKMSKARWYLEKCLGNLVSEQPFIVKLNFEPSGRAAADKVYRHFLRYSKTCFICGKEDPFVFKNIIPFEYRKYFPEFNLSQITDVVKLCKECLKISNNKDMELRTILAEEFDEVARNKEIKMVRNAAEKLKKGDQLSEQTQKLEETLKEYFHTDTITEDLLTKAELLDQISHNYKVFKHYEKVGLVHLENRCRQWFLDSMNPKFMPEIWSVSTNIELLKAKMSRYPLDHPIRKDYKIILVGTEGEIDVPYEPKTYFNSSDSKDSEVSQPFVTR